jgi:hypothetical protein
MKPPDAPRPARRDPALARFYTRQGKGGVTELVDRKHDKVLSHWSLPSQASAERDRLARDDKS